VRVIKDALKTSHKTCRHLKFLRFQILKIEHLIYVHLNLVLSLFSSSAYIPYQIYAYLLTYLLTPWCRILLEKLTGFQLVSLLQLCSRNSASNSVCVNAAQRSDWDCDVSLSVCLGAFAKLRKATISCVISSRQHATTRLPLEGFQWNLIFEYFSKVWRESSRFTNIWPEKKNRYFTWISVQIYDNKGKVTPLQTRCGPEGG